MNKMDYRNKITGFQPPRPPQRPPSKPPMEPICHRCLEARKRGLPGCDKHYPQGNQNTQSGGFQRQQYQQITYREVEDQRQQYQQGGYREVGDQRQQYQ